MIGVMSMGATSGKLALVSNTTLLTGSCPTGPPWVVDFVGYGSTANCFEGAAPTVAPSVTNSVIRPGTACTDTNSNTADFVTQPAAPRNGATPADVCACTVN